jgi:hypothetical protein
MHGIGDKIVPSRSSEVKKCCVQDSIHNSQNPEIFISFSLFTVLKEDRFDFMNEAVDCTNVQKLCFYYTVVFSFLTLVEDC